MNTQIELLNHNYYFHNCLCDIYPDKFYDWKITVLYYCAYNGLKALSVVDGIDIGTTHHDIELHANPKYINRNKKAYKIQIKKTAWDDYNSLYNYSTTARYNGMIDTETFDALKKEDYARCLVHFENFIRYIHIEKGVPMAIELESAASTVIMAKKRTPIALHTMRGVPVGANAPREAPAVRNAFREAPAAPSANGSFIERLLNLFKGAGKYE
jgi:hypothetical protein